ncbi:hypothetical protein [Actinoallomurus acaciae]|uniref:Uncharacterized protein n=1 Tax=Actinoallomurus acaciae TaxID=502577 RepID=A0ABV5YUP5_9ACTN
MVDRRSGAMFGLFPVGEDRLCWFTGSLLDGPPPDADEGRRQMLSLMAGWYPLVTELIETAPPADIYLDPIARLAVPLPSFAVGRIVLLGDPRTPCRPASARPSKTPAALARHLTGAEPADVTRRLLRYGAERRPGADRILGAATRQARG